jgi:hypothetical protein
MASSRFYGLAFDLLAPLAFQDQRTPPKHTVFLKLFASDPSHWVHEQFSAVAKVAAQ